MLKLFGCSLAGDRQAVSVPGKINSLTEKGFGIETGKGSIIVAEIQASGKKRLPVKEEIQASGKKRLPVKEFQRGSTLSVGSILGK
jgi:methionyl-tRNA formyltransferase